jgi:hypothetical protein
VGGGAAWWIASAGASRSVDSIGDTIETRPRGQTPRFVEKPEIAALYRFAVDNPDVLSSVACTCGCAQLGHASNRSCYVKQETKSHVTYTSHAAT